MSAVCCSVSACDRPVAARGLCKTHYGRQREGRPLDAPLQEKTSGGSTGECSLEGCDGPARSRRLCSRHYLRWLNNGDPTVVRKSGRKPGYARDTHGMWRGKDVGYHGAHKRVYAQRGAASSHACADCGEPARHWSYDHADPNERSSDLGPYSLDPDRYRPRCSRCHKLYDVIALRASGWTPWNKGPEVCTVQGCEGKAHARGWCRAHYGRWYKSELRSKS